jgi:hypothetical protein
MRYRFHHVENAPLADVEEFVKERAGLLESRLTTFEPDLVHLDARLSYNGKRQSDRRDDAPFTNHLVLDLPGGKLPNIGASGYGETWTSAVYDAFGALETQLDKTLADLHGVTAIHEYRRRPSWERSGAEKLGKPQVEPKK